MTKKKKEDDNLLDELGKLDDPELDIDGDISPEPDEPELSIVDKFVAGDMEAVKQSIQDQVIKTVSDVVNGTTEADPEPESD